MISFASESRMMIIYVFLSLLALYVLLKSRVACKRWKRPPGPKGLPMIGCALEINAHNILEKFYTYAEEYGEIFGIKLLHQRMICLSSERIIRKALASVPYRQYMNNKAKSFYAETMLFGSESVLSYEDPHSRVHVGMRKGVFIDNALKMVRKRIENVAEIRGYINALCKLRLNVKSIHGIFRGIHVYGQEGINEFEMKILQELDRLTQTIESYGDREFDAVALIRCSLTNLLSIVLSGEASSDDDQDLKMFLDYIDGADFFFNSSVNNVLTMCPFLRHAPGYRSNYQSMCNAKNKIIQRYFHNRKNRAVGKPRGLVDHLIETQTRSLEEGQEVIFTDERIMSSILETVVAGVLTNWSIISSTILCLVNNPEYQDKVFKEVDENIGRDRLPLHSDKRNCPHLEALELEAHRYMTVVPILGGRICTKNISMDGYDIAKGTMVMVNIWYMHHDPKIWGDPWTFRPERFLDADGQLLPMDHMYRKNWMPFSIGRRQCIGEQFARSRYFLYMVTMLKRWKFIGSPGKFGPCDPRYMDNIETNATIRPKPFFCTAERRY